MKKNAKRNSTKSKKKSKNAKNAKKKAKNGKQAGLRWAKLKKKLFSKLGVHV